MKLRTIQSKLHHLCRKTHIILTGLYSICITLINFAVNLNPYSELMDENYTTNHRVNQKELIKEGTGVWGNKTVLDDFFGGDGLFNSHYCCMSNRPQIFSNASLEEVTDLGKISLNQRENLWNNLFYKTIQT